MAVPAALLQQLLALGETEREEIAQALLASVDEDDGLSAVDRRQLHAAIERSLEEIAAGEAVPLDEVLVSLRARRLHRPTR